MTIFEALIDASKRQYGLEFYNKYENFLIVKASLYSGVVSAVIINFLEVLVIRK